MKEQKQQTWCLPDSVTPESVLETISLKFSFKTGQSQQKNIVCFDTFDWQLYRKDCFLHYSSSTWTLSCADKKKNTELREVSAPGKRIFSWEFPPGRLRNELEAKLNIRALLPIVRLNVTSTPIRILNKDGDGICLLVFTDQKALETGNILRTVELHGVPGYTRHMRSIRHLLRSLKIIEYASAASNLKKLLKGSERIPGGYTSKFSIQLNPNNTAGQAMGTIYKQLLMTMIRNEEGIVNDLDMEFLHDFRVALRRMRSGLSQIKNILPPAVTTNFKTEFSYLGSITGPTRDIDVYLHYEENYKSRLPPALRPALDLFFTNLSRRRGEELGRLTKALKAPRYTQIKSAWQHYLENGEMAGDASLPVTEVARTTISRQYGKIIKNGMLITRESPDESLHNLRIRGKKLRYSLEFFASLFPKKEISKLIKQLKRLQNNLGDFNDLSMQQEMLHNYLKGLRPGARKNMELATAIGGLLTNLYHEQHGVREEFFAKFTHFSSEQNLSLVKRLFF